MIDVSAPNTTLPRAFDPLGRLGLIVTMSDHRLKALYRATVPDSSHTSGVIQTWNGETSTCLSGDI